MDFIYNERGVCLNPTIVWRYEDGHYFEAEIIVAPIGDKWDSSFSWGTLRAGAHSRVCISKYSDEETAINEAVADVKRQLNYIKSQCRNESEFNKMHESFRRFLASRTQLTLF